MIHNYYSQRQFRSTIPFFILLTLSAVALQIYNGNIKGGVVYRDYFLAHLLPFWYRCVREIIIHYLKVYTMDFSVTLSLGEQLWK
jgi:hypothetical protein